MQETENPKIIYIEKVIKFSLILGVLNSIILMIFGVLLLLAYGFKLEYPYILYNENIFYNALIPLFITLVLNTIIRILKEMEKMV